MEYARKITPPPDVNQIYLVGRYEILKHLRSRRLYGILAIEMIIVILLLAVPPLAGHEYSSDPAKFAGDFFNWTWILVVIGATLFAGDSLVSEFQNRTGYLIFPNPVKRSSIFFGKFAASVAIMFMVILIYYGLASAAALIITGGVSSLTLSSLGLAMLFTIAATAVGYLISSIMKGGTGALVLTFAFLFLIMPIIDGVMQVVGVKPNFSITFAAGAIQYVMQTPYPTDFTETIPLPGGGVFELTMYYPEVAIAISIAIVYIVVGIALALWRFNVREMAA